MMVLWAMSTSMRYCTKVNASPRDAKRHRGLMLKEHHQAPCGSLGEELSRTLGDGYSVGPVDGAGRVCDPH